MSIELTTYELGGEAYLASEAFDHPRLVLKGIHQTSSFKLVKVDSFGKGLP